VRRESVSKLALGWKPENQKKNHYFEYNDWSLSDYETVCHFFWHCFCPTNLYALKKFHTVYCLNFLEFGKEQMCPLCSLFLEMYSITSILTQSNIVMLVNKTMLIHLKTNRKNNCQLENCNNKSMLLFFIFLFVEHDIRFIAFNSCLFVFKKI
jgi:hypothetical protein